MENEYETPIDQIRPQMTRDTNLNERAVLDYNEVLKTIPQQSTNHETNMNIPTYEQVPHQSTPQLQYRNNNSMSNNTSISQQDIHQLKSILSNDASIKQRISKNIGLQETEQKEYIYLLIVVSILFSTDVQEWLSKILPNLYKDGKQSLISLVFNAFIICLGLYLTRKIKIDF